jgi:sigma-B regulation protein RsbU (phosphoserine phosphatase)
VSTPARILVVDDIEMNRDLLSRRLRRLGHDVRIAIDGRDALDAMRRDEMDLVLLDIMMPEMNGYEVLEHMKGDATLRHVPVVMVSALDEMASVVRCIELGAEDYLPKPFDPVLLRARVGACLEKKWLRDRERLHAQSLERELQIGRSIQQGFFPESLPALDGWEIAAAFESARQVSGDFYDAFPVGGGALVALLVGDVCDKGVGAALFMALFRSLLRATSEREGIAAVPNDAAALAVSIVTTTNDYIARTHGRSNMFATIFFALLDPANGTIAYVNAGHEPPRVLLADGRRALLAPTGPAAGMLEDVPFTAATLTLGTGDALLVVTDGVTEARGTDGSLFGDDRLDALLVGGARGAAELLAEVHGAVQSRGAGVPLSDDLTMLAVRRR